MPVESQNIYLCNLGKAKCKKVGYMIMWGCAFLPQYVFQTAYLVTTLRYLSSRIFRRRLFTLVETSLESLKS